MPPKPEPEASVRWSQVLALRLERHHLAERTTPDRLVDVVGELVGIHAQVMSGLRPDDVLGKAGPSTFSPRRISPTGAVAWRAEPRSHSDPANGCG